jgi:hypothetical protein
MNKTIFGALCVALTLVATTVDQPVAHAEHPDVSLAMGANIVDVVNDLPYSYRDMTPVLWAYRAVTEERGWAQEDIDAFENFVVNDVIYGESGGCPNVRGGAIMKGDGCEVKRQGRKSDSGFGQVIRIHYRYPNGWLCKQESLCSADDITSNAWNSMTALVALIERDGKRPWCYSAAARRYHRGCATAPRHKPVVNQVLP